MQKQAKKTAPKILKKGNAVPKKPFVVEDAKAAVRPNSQLQGPHKTFQQDGHWIEKPNKTAILICTCGNRYLKTRPRQEKCLRCISSTLTLRR
jgi:hypothetical protein